MVAIEGVRGTGIETGVGIKFQCIPFDTVKIFEPCKRIIYSVE